MLGLASNPKRVLDSIGVHVAKINRGPTRSPFLFIKDGEDYYCLKISSYSLLEDDDDMVLVRRTEDVKDEDIIVGVVDGRPMLRKYRNFGDRVELHATNLYEPPIVLTEENDFRVAGVFVGHFNEYD